MAETVNYRHISDVAVAPELRETDTILIEREGQFQRISGKQITDLSAKIPVMDEFNRLLFYNHETGEYEAVDLLRGESAYEAAVRLGYTTLSEEEWLREYEVKRDSAIDQMVDKANQEIDRVAALGGQVLQTIPSDYTKLASDVADLGVNTASPISKSVTGKFLKINDAANKPLAGLKLYGRTDQAKTTGKNLLNLWNGRSGYGDGGVTYTNNGDGSYKRRGTANNVYGNVWFAGNFQVKPNDSNVIITLLPGETYYIRDCALYTADDSGTSVCIFDNASDGLTPVSGFVTVNASKYPNGVKITGVRNPQMVVGAGYADVIHPLIAKGAVPVEWEPYTGGIPGPNPNYPLKLKSPGDSGSINIRAQGKNIAKVESVASVSTLYGTMASIRPFKLTAGMTYTLSFDTQNTGILCYVNPNSFGKYMQFTMDGKRKTFTFSYDSDLDMIVEPSNKTFLVSRRAETSDVASGLISNIQIEIGETATAYEPYKDGGSLNASTPNGLPGIPVGSGGNYTDTDGQQWLCDEIDFERGVYVQRVFHKLLTGSENWTVVNNCFKFDDWIATEKVGHVIIERGAMTNYVYRNYAQLESGQYGVTYAYNWRFRLPDMNPDNNTVEECKAWLASNPIDFYIPMQAPVETSLSTSELAAYCAMSTFAPYTVVYSDSDVRMTVDYTGETEKFVHKVVDDRTAPPIVETANGSVVSVNDSAHRPFAGLRLYGKTTQITTTGKNLLNASKCEFNNAVTEKFAELVRIRDSITFPPGVKYVISFDTTNTGIACYVNEELVGTATHFTMDGNRKSFVFSYTDGKTVSNPRCITRYSETSSVSAGTISNIMIEVGSTATAYEPYTGGIPAPNPNYPQPLVNVGADGIIKTDALGKNLYDLSQGIDYNLRQPFPIKAGEYYSVSVYPLSGTTQINFKLEYIDGTKMDYGIVGTDGPNNMWYHSSAKASKDIASICFYNVSTPNRTIGKIMVRRGQLASMTDADYEPYKDGGSVAVITPNGLPGIPVSSGGNYTDASGQQWLCDEVDFARGVYVQNCKLATSFTFRLYDASRSVFIANLGFSKQMNVGMCNMYSPRWDASVSNMPDKSWRKIEYDEVFIRDTAYTTAEAFNAAMKDKLTILCPIATPVEKPLSADELYAYNAMTSQKLTTTVCNDAGVDMAVDYIADTKAYIDKQLAAIAATLIE